MIPDIQDPTVEKASHILLLQISLTIVLTFLLAYTKANPLFTTANVSVSVLLIGAYLLWRIGGVRKETQVIDTAVYTSVFLGLFLGPGIGAQLYLTLSETAVPDPLSAVLSVIVGLAGLLGFGLYIRHLSKE